MKIGCCGWSRFRPEKKQGTILQEYAKVFDLVEVNSTFYRIPKIKTAEKWLEEAKSVNKNFEFTVKCNRFITHENRFGSESKGVFETMLGICHALDAEILLIQTPASFSDLKKLDTFLDSVDYDVQIAFEYRSKKKDGLEELLHRHKLIHAVDPLREPCLTKQQYFRLHGFGMRIYDYKFSEEELKKALSLCKPDAYVLFNNYFMYEQALQFISISKKRSS